MGPGPLAHKVGSHGSRIETRESDLFDNSSTVRAVPADSSSIGEGIIQELEKKIFFSPQTPVPYDGGLTVPRALEVATLAEYVLTGGESTTALARCCIAP